LMRLRPTELPDPRLLAVTISEADIRAQSPDRRGSLSDEALDRLLNILTRQQARVIGIDVYRDYPVGADYPELAARLQRSDRIVGACKSLDPTVGPVGVDPPPELAEDMTGFSDFVEDADGVIRRHLVALEPDPASSCTTPYAFSARLAFLYLQGEDITPSFDMSGNLVMGQAVFRRLHARSGGYSSIDARGNQIMLNYRALSAPSDVASQVSLTQILEGQVNPEAIANRIVLIGVTAPSLTDAWATPYGQSGNDKTAGVFLQAQMTSQLISAALGERPVLKAWPLWAGVLWIGGWAAAGWSVSIVVFSTGTASMRKRAGLGVVLLSTGFVLLGGGSLWLLTTGYWVPLVPAGLALGASSLGGLASRVGTRLA
ncbi:MAG: CHASE2 domain-containing protein, partial [Phormidesmis sp.]